MYDFKASRPRRIKDITGKKFNRWTVIRLGEMPVGYKSKSTFWLCRCDCGTERAVRRADLVSGKSYSCGCYNVDRAREAHTKHGENTRGDGPTKEYRTWARMLKRCENHNDKWYPSYGGNGITVCERWHDFANFLADMGRAPSPLHSIDRIDNTLGYSPDNCRWATATEQANNKTNNHMIEYDNRIMTVAEFSHEIGIRAPVIYSRIYRGWTIERIAATPLMKQRSSRLRHIAT